MRISELQKQLQYFFDCYGDRDVKFVKKKRKTGGEKDLSISGVYFEQQDVVLRTKDV